jgi:hypothetical protein
MVSDLATAGAVLVVVSIVALWLWVRRRPQPAPHCVSEEEARENAAPLSTAITKRSQRD